MSKDGSLQRPGLDWTSWATPFVFYTGQGAMQQTVVR